MHIGAGHSGQFLRANRMGEEGKEEDKYTCVGARVHESIDDDFAWTLWE